MVVLEGHTILVVDEGRGDSENFYGACFGLLCVLCFSVWLTVSSWFLWLKSKLCIWFLNGESVLSLVDILLFDIKVKVFYDIYWLYMCKKVGFEE